ncbi:conserved hypothetical protein [Neospora caninum Liverpool]|uniref:Uncharacterized protein n=1 Tax=Neospora caninum (strain Liverpool) TaxID=572307 RepID=F0VBS9_NEOCL|nr:conserved hypothetical protein [Neospora caninum Liverpool]CBZ51063.1 conserved hypothetical protein [Neospora caninum Liverpool]|eukprot:XP_003881096.1 conserved hypothetical protein [Neospora caninum Liverpool]
MDFSSKKICSRLWPNRRAPGDLCDLKRAALRQHAGGFLTLHAALLSLPALVCLFFCQDADAVRLAGNAPSAQGTPDPSLLVLHPLQELVPSLALHAFPPSLHHLRLFRALPLNGDVDRVARSRGTDEANAPPRAAETLTEQVSASPRRNSMVLAVLPSRHHEGLPRDPPEILPSDVCGASVISSLFGSSSRGLSAPVSALSGTLIVSVSSPEARADTVSPSSVHTLPSSSLGVSAPSPSQSSPSYVPSSSLLAAAASAASCCDAVVLPMPYSHLSAPISLLGQKEPQLLLLSAAIEQQLHLSRGIAVGRTSSCATLANGATASPVEVAPAHFSRAAAALASGEPARRPRSEGGDRQSDGGNATQGNGESSNEGRCVSRTSNCDQSEVERVVTKRKPLIILVTDYTDVSAGQSQAETPTLPVIALGPGNIIEDVSLGRGPEDDSLSCFQGKTSRQRSKLSAEERQRDDRSRGQRRATATAVRLLLERLCRNLDPPGALAGTSQDDEKGGETGERGAGDYEDRGHPPSENRKGERNLEGDSGSTASFVEIPPRGTMERSSIERNQKEDAVDRRSAVKENSGTGLDSLYSAYVVFVPPTPAQNLGGGAGPDQARERRDESLQISQRLQRTVEGIVLLFKQENASSRSSDVDESSSFSALQSLPQVAGVYERLLGESSRRSQDSASRSEDSSVEAEDSLPSTEARQQTRLMAIEARRSTWAAVRDIRQAMASGDAEPASKVVCEYALRRIKDQTKDRFDALLNLQPPPFHVGYSRSFPVVASELRRAALQLFESSAHLVREQMMKATEKADFNQRRKCFRAVEERFREELDREITRQLSPRYFLQLNALRAEITRQFRTQLDHVQKEQLSALEAFLMRRQQPGLPQSDEGEEEETVPELLSFRRFSRLTQALLKAAGTAFLTEMRRFHRSCSPYLLLQLTRSFESPSPSSSSASRRILALLEQRQHLRLLENLREMASSVLQQQQLLLAEYAGGLKGGIWSTNPVASWVLDGLAETSERMRASRAVQAVRHALAKAESQSTAVRTLLGWWRRRAPVEVSLQYVSPTAFGLSNFRRRVGLSPEETALAGRRTSLKGKIQKLWSGAEASSRASPSPKLAPTVSPFITHGIR